MTVDYNVELPQERMIYGRYMKSEEALLIDKFLTSGDENMCFTYEDEEDAKKRMRCINSYRYRQGHSKRYILIRVREKIYIAKVGEVA
jgi:hypothetical protein